LVPLRNFLEELRTITNKTKFCTRPSIDPPLSEGISGGGGVGDNREDKANRSYRKQPLSL
jgi:hypothetical protein